MCRSNPNQRWIQRRTWLTLVALLGVLWLFPRMGVAEGAGPADSPANAQVPPGPDAAPGDEIPFVRIEGVRGVNEPERFVEDEFIVVLSGPARAAVAVAHRPDGRPEVSLASLQGVIQRNRVNRFARQFRSARPEPPGSPFHDLTGHYKVRIDAGVNLDDAIAAFSADPHVDHVEKIGIAPIYSCATGTAVTPNDLYYEPPPIPAQWALWDAYGIDANLAWSTETGDPSVVVAVMDTGVRYYHKDLGGNNPPDPNALDGDITDGNIWVNTGEIPGNGIDDDSNGYIDDVVGWDFVSGNPRRCDSKGGEDCEDQDNDPRDHYGHGTPIAGIMAAITNNGKILYEDGTWTWSPGTRVAGIAGGWGDGYETSAANGSKIMCLRIGWEDIHGSAYVRMDYAAEAMQYVADMKNGGVNIAAVNCSWGSFNDGGLGVAVDNVLAADVMIIHAAGNDDYDYPDYLGSKDGVLNVAATDQDRLKASFSNYGSWVDVAAPGVDIISTYHNSDDPDSDYFTMKSGTSFAAPQVAGVAALLESLDPALSGPDKFALIVNNTCLAGSPDIGGILNAKLALDAAAPPPACTSDADCDDGNLCTTDVCSEGVCFNTPIDCDDGDACTTDTCSGGICFNDPISCDDGDACTTDSCDPVTGCVNEPIHCDDGDACTADSCDPATGWCINDPIVPCCGDTFCDAGEDPCSCPADCGVPPSMETNCTDGIDEDCDGLIDCDDADCTGDPSCPSTVCGNGVCEGGGEDCVTCPADCRSAGKGGRDCCGDGACTGSENTSNCPVDCGG